MVMLRIPVFWEVKSSGEWFLMYPRSVVCSSTRVKLLKKNIFLERLMLKMRKP
jgi:hypothetical protein